MRSYRSGFLPFFHVDAYRLGSIGEFEDLAAIESAEDGVVVIEWGGAVSAALPKDRLEIELVRNPDESRTIRIQPSGSWNTRQLSEVEA
jgi:tRNA threonylcarbamoyladenosine biosynthesis protein TsaE